MRFLAPPSDAAAVPADQVDDLFRRYRRITIIGLIATYGLYYTCRLGLSIVKKPLIDNGTFSAEQLGWIGAGFFWTYGLGKLTNGMIADRVNLRVFISLGLAVSAVANIVFGINQLVVVAIVLWGVNGWFQGIGGPSSVVGISRWFGAKERGTMYGLWSMSHSVGEGITFGLTSALVGATAWQAAFIAPGLACLLAAVLAFMLLRHSPQSIGLPAVSKWRGEPAPLASARVTLREQLAILKLPAIWILGLSSAAMYVSRYAVNSWGTLYLQETHGFSVAEAGSLIGVNTIAGIGGCAAYGWISDRFFAARRPPLTLVFGILEIAALAVFLWAPAGGSPTLLVGALIVYGFTLSGLLAVIGGMFAMDLVPKNAVGAAMGIIGAFSYLGAGLQEMISGMLIERGTTVVDGVRTYDFGDASVFWLGASIASAILAASLWRVRVKD